MKRQDGEHWDRVKVVISRPFRAAFEATTNGRSVAMRPIVSVSSKRAHLDQFLPAKSQVSPVENHPALPYAELPAFMASPRRNLEFATGQTGDRARSRA